VATIQYKVPRANCLKPTDETGQVAIFQIGNQKFRFVIQKNREFIGPCLVHWASGQIVANPDVLKSIKIRNMHGGKTVTTREACRLALQDLEKRIGTGKIIATLLAAPVINRGA
jgi:hypothetical protein